MVTYMSCHFSVHSFAACLLTHALPESYAVSCCCFLHSIHLWVQLTVYKAG